MKYVSKYLALVVDEDICLSVTTTTRALSECKHLVSANSTKVKCQTRVLRDSNPDYRINPDSDLLDQSHNVVDSLPYRRQSFCQISLKNWWVNA